MIRHTYQRFEEDSFREVSQGSRSERRKGEAIIRPLEKQDEGLLGRFYAELPDSDRWFMRYDVLDSIMARDFIFIIKSCKCGAVTKIY